MFDEFKDVKTSVLLWDVKRHHVNCVKQHNMTLAIM